MCYAVQCRTCGKTSWGGCGQHVDTVMRSVPVADRCTCSKEPRKGTGAGGGRGFFRRFSRRA